ncbi:hypothetical protein PR048_029735 [Dryococelus australis]|uniref:Uncharacterized protein n=1 Tax=Dryococelus australis TaxID=614101 RepID=A0ABQ9GE83_9NEOP|nr:hypothetical protein PR048_029735 [Dryococelus australis]
MRPVKLVTMEGKEFHVLTSLVSLCMWYSDCVTAEVPFRDGFPTSSFSMHVFHYACGTAIVLLQKSSSGTAFSPLVSLCMWYSDCVTAEVLFREDPQPSSFTMHVFLYACGTAIVLLQKSSSGTAFSPLVSLCMWYSDCVTAKVLFRDGFQPSSFTMHVFLYACGTAIVLLQKSSSGTSFSSLVSLCMWFSDCVTAEVLFRDGFQPSSFSMHVFHYACGTAIVLLQKSSSGTAFSPLVSLCMWYSDCVTAEVLFRDDPQPSSFTMHVFLYACGTAIVLLQKSSSGTAFSPLVSLCMWYSDCVTAEVLFRDDPQPSSFSMHVFHYACGTAIVLLQKSSSGTAFSPLVSLCMWYSDCVTAEVLFRDLFQPSSFSMHVFLYACGTAIVLLEKSSSGTSFRPLVSLCMWYSDCVTAEVLFRDGFQPSSFHYACGTAIVLLQKSSSGTAFSPLVSLCMWYSDCVTAEVLFRDLFQPSSFSMHVVQRLCYCRSPLQGPLFSPLVSLCMWYSDCVTAEVLFRDGFQPSSFSMHVFHYACGTAIVLLQKSSSGTAFRSLVSLCMWYSDCVSAEVLFRDDPQPSSFTMHVFLYACGTAIVLLQKSSSGTSFSPLVSLCMWYSDCVTGEVLFRDLFPPSISLCMWTAIVTAEVLFRDGFQPSSFTMHVVQRLCYLQKSSSGTAFSPLVPLCMWYSDCVTAEVLFRDGFQPSGTAFSPLVSLCMWYSDCVTAEVLFRDDPQPSSFTMHVVLRLCYCRTIVLLQKSSSGTAFSPLVSLCMWYSDCVTAEVLFRDLFQPSSFSMHVGRFSPLVSYACGTAIVLLQKSSSGTAFSPLVSLCMWYSDCVTEKSSSGTSFRPLVSLACVQRLCYCRRTAFSPLVPLCMWYSDCVTAEVLFRDGFQPSVSLACGTAIVLLQKSSSGTAFSPLVSLCMWYSDCVTAEVLFRDAFSPLVSLCMWYSDCVTARRTAFSPLVSLCMWYSDCVTAEVLFRDGFQPSSFTMHVFPYACGTAIVLLQKSSSGTAFSPLVSLCMWYSDCVTAEVLFRDGFQPSSFTMHVFHYACGTAIVFTAEVLFRTAFSPLVSLCMWYSDCVTAEVLFRDGFQPSSFTMLYACGTAIVLLQKSSSGTAFSPLVSLCMWYSDCVTAEVLFRDGFQPSSSTMHVKSSSGTAFSPLVSLCMWYSDCVTAEVLFRDGFQLSSFSMHVVQRLCLLTKSSSGTAFRPLVSLCMWYSDCFTAEVLFRDGFPPSRTSFSPLVSLSMWYSDCVTAEVLFRDGFQPSSFTMHVVQRLCYLQKSSSGTTLSPLVSLCMWYSDCVTDEVLFRDGFPPSSFTMHVKSSSGTAFSPLVSLCMWYSDCVTAEVLFRDGFQPSSFTMHVFHYACGTAIVLLQKSSSVTAFSPLVSLCMWYSDCVTAEVLFRDGFQPSSFTMHVFHYACGTAIVLLQKSSSGTAFSPLVSLCMWYSDCVTAEVLFRDGFQLSSFSMHVFHYACGTAIVLLQKSSSGTAFRPLVSLCMWYSDCVTAEVLFRDLFQPSSFTIHVVQRLCYCRTIVLLQKSSSGTAFSPLVSLCMWYSDCVTAEVLFRDDPQPSSFTMHVVLRLCYCRTIVLLQKSSSGTAFSPLVSLCMWYSDCVTAEVLFRDDPQPSSFAMHVFLYACGTAIVLLQKSSSGTAFSPLVSLCMWYSDCVTAEVLFRDDPQPSSFTMHVFLYACGTAIVLLQKSSSGTTLSPLVSLCMWYSDCVTAEVLFRDGFQPSSFSMHVFHYACGTAIVLLQKSSSGTAFSPLVSLCMWYSDCVTAEVLFRDGFQPSSFTMHVFLYACGTAIVLLQKSSSGTAFSPLVSLCMWYSDCVTAEVLFRDDPQPSSFAMHVKSSSGTAFSPLVSLCMWYSDCVTAEVLFRDGFQPSSFTRGCYYIKNRPFILIVIMKDLPVGNEGNKDKDNLSSNHKLPDICLYANSNSFSKKITIQSSSNSARVYATPVDYVGILCNCIVAGCETIRNVPGIHQHILVSMQWRVDAFVRVYGGHCEVSCITQTNNAMAFHSNMIQPAGHTFSFTRPTHENEVMRINYGDVNPTYGESVNDMHTSRHIRKGFQKCSVYRAQPMCGDMNPATSSTSRLGSRCQRTVLVSWVTWSGERCPSCRLAGVPTCMSTHREATTVIEVSMEQRRDKGAGETGDPRENPPTSGIVLFPLVGGERANHLATVAPFINVLHFWCHSRGHLAAFLVPFRGHLAAFLAPFPWASSCISGAIPVDI